ncbi:MAG: hypothetical protein K1X89_08500 [Myxococcaceae bacterium]|nr:hypothetical protein [Myxococcaceae bacterium]
MLPALALLLLAGLPATLAEAGGTCRLERTVRVGRGYSSSCTGGGALAMGPAGGLFSAESREGQVWWPLTAAGDRAGTAPSPGEGTWSLRGTVGSCVVATTDGRCGGETRGTCLTLRAWSPKNRAWTEAVTVPVAGDRRAILLGTDDQEQLYFQNAPGAIDATWLHLGCDHEQLTVRETRFSAPRDERAEFPTPDAWSLPGQPALVFRPDHGKPFFRLEPDAGLWPLDVSSSIRLHAARSDGGSLELLVEDAKGYQALSPGADAGRPLSARELARWPQQIYAGFGTTGGLHLDRSGAGVDDSERRGVYATRAITAAPSNAEFASGRFHAAYTVRGKENAEQGCDVDYFIAQVRCGGR